MTEHDQLREKLARLQLGAMMQNLDTVVREAEKRTSDSSPP
jgi:hypothetical protein